MKANLVFPTLLVALDVGASAAFAAQAAYATRRENEDSIVDLVSAIIETRIQKEEKNGCEGK